MQVKNIVQATANIIRVTQLTKGNIVKLVENQDSSYGADISYAVVMDILNDGDKCFVDLLKYKKNYSSVTLEQRVLNGDKDVTLFPATPEDLQQHLKTIESTLRDQIQDKRDEATKNENALNLLVDMVSKQEITASQFEELPAHI